MSREWSCSHQCPWVCLLGVGGHHSNLCMLRPQWEINQKKRQKKAGERPAPASKTGLRCDEAGETQQRPACWQKKAEIAVPTYAGETVPLGPKTDAPHHCQFSVSSHDPLGPCVSTAAKWPLAHFDLRSQPNVVVGADDVVPWCVWPPAGMCRSKRRTR